MGSDFFRRLVWAVGMLAVQVLVFNHIHWLGYATPVAYVYVLCLLPLNASRCEWLLWGFFTGLSADFFSGIPGVGAFSMTLAAFCAPWLLRLFAPKDSVEDMVPGYDTLGVWKYVGYVTSLVLLQQMAMVTVEFFSFFNGLDMLYTGLSGSTLTIVLILVLERLRGKS